LAAGVGEAEAAGIYARLLYAYLLELVAADLPGVALELSVASEDDVPFFSEAFPEFTVRAQRRGDLGKRLAASFADAFADGAEAVVVTASDTVGLGPDLLRAAFEALEGAPLVVGPCRDGGYYLLGMRAPGAPLFEGVDWGTELVLAQTEALARAEGVELPRLPERFDVDTAADLVAWRRYLLRDVGKGE
jgi:hypothetical protein